MGRSDQNVRIKMSSAPHGKSQADLVGDIETHAADPILNQATVASVLGVHKSTVHRWLETGAMLAVRNPKGILKVRKSTVLNFVRSSKWGDDKAVIETLEGIEDEEVSQSVTVDPVDETNKTEELVSDGNTQMVGDSGSSQASNDNHHRRNNRHR